MMALEIFWELNLVLYFSNIMSTDSFIPSIVIGIATGNKIKAYLGEPAPTYSSEELKPNIITKHENVNLSE